MIHFSEKKLYKKSVFRGIVLVVFVLSIVSFFALSVMYYIQSVFPPFMANILLGVLASMFVAHKMLRDCVGNILEAEDKKAAIGMLVSRDTQNMTQSDIYKAAIETYAENLSDGVIAPLLYLLLFNLPGIIIYKTINTMDSMLGYRNEKYEKFGKAAARLDDIANYIPSRLTALLIMLAANKRPLLAFYKDGKKHDSPNAGHPITAMALAIGVQLGGDTSYFGEIKKKAHFGTGEKKISPQHLKKALAIV